MFDLLRKHGQTHFENKLIEMSGTGAWKKLTVFSQDTGEVLIEKKFYKADFKEVWEDPEFKPYIDVVF